MDIVKPSRGEQINDSLRKHQISISDWDRQALAEDLHIWTDRFVLEFKLEVGECPALIIKKLRRYSNGHFHYGRNGFGLRNEIAIDENHANISEYWQILGTLLHELIHCEQQATGTNDKSTKRRNYHNKAFIERAKSFGMIVNRRGRQQYAPPPTPFSELLKLHGVEMSAGDDDKEDGQNRDQTTSGSSKLRLWVCACKPKPVRVRVAIKDFQARCLKCGQVFVRV